MLQDNKSGRTSSNVDGSGGKALSRRITGNGCSRRSDRSYSMGSTTEMMINDFDDERTLDEEEALEGSEDSHNELSNLQKEGDMPLKELLAKYGYSQRTSDNSDNLDQMSVVRSGGDGRLASEKGDNDGNNEYEDEEAEETEDEEAGDDEDEEEAEEDVDEEEASSDDADDEENNVPARMSGDKMFKQLSLKEFYVEMIKMDAKRMCIAGPNAVDGLECENVAGGRADDDGGISGCAAAESCGEESETRGRVNDGTGSSNENPTGRSGANGGGGSSRLLRSVSRPQSEEEDDDCDYSPDEEEWKKTIMVGSDYQATIPEGLCRYDDALPYENEDKILWNPSYIPEEEVEEFLERAQLPSVKGNDMPAGGHVRDDEQALYLLLQCGYSLEEALRRRWMNVLPPTDSISLWSEEECHNFESGLRTYGKDFHLIQRNKVRTRSVGELVQFYYLWKKTERHDIFTYKARMEKKKYALHPGITDYMDRFLEEQEGVRDRSSSPNVNCLLYGDAKRQRSSSNTLANNHNEQVTSVETWDGVTIEDSLGDMNNANVNTNASTAASATTTATTTTTTTTTTTSTPSNWSSTAATPTAPPSSSPTPTTGTNTTTDSSTGTTSLPQTRATGENPPANHTHDGTRQCYSPTPENVLSNLPP